MSTTTIASPPRAKSISSRSGKGNVELTLVAGKTAVTRCRANSPLKLLTPRSSGGGAWIFSGTYGGGLVAGDSIHLDIFAGAKTTCLLSTQASTKIYRTESTPCAQELNVIAESGAILIARQIRSCVLKIRTSCRSNIFRLQPIRAGDDRLVHQRPPGERGALGDAEISKRQRNFRRRALRFSRSPAARSRRRPDRRSDRMGRSIASRPL